ncbi:hypothetical protein TUMEXPCC7403_22920 [Tumidithrix helvetica PCC 7403]|uniref:hypothetical protein n=1 Tax=Tumidithrix helvetica TaxID=3457545 RepID=UPI003CB9E341
MQFEDEQEILERQIESQVERLIDVQTWGRWLFNLCLWLTIGSASIWSLRFDIAIWIEYFTWAAVRSSMQSHRLAFLGITFCVAMTLATLVWQSSQILWGISNREKRSLIRQVQKIQQQGKAHPLWRWVCKDKTK